MINKTLVPIIFSHGLCSRNTTYSTYIRELVSHGYIVFAIDHLDGSNAYTELQNGIEKPFDVSSEIWDYKHKRTCANIR